MDKRELFFCCRTGNLTRIRYLVEEKDVNLNARDKWGGTPLYYACLCGHFQVVQYLLQSGVQCDANTFDGERCLYGALTDQIRHLLQNFHVISPETMRRDKYREFLRRSFELSDYSDIQFIIEKEITPAHRSILACRSKFFLHSLKSLWKDGSFIDLTNLNISLGILKSLIQYLYMGQVSLDRKEINIFIPLAEHFCMNSLITEIKRILQTSERKIQERNVKAMAGKHLNCCLGTLDVTTGQPIRLHFALIHLKDCCIYLINKKHTVSYLQPQSLLQQEYSKLFLSSLPKELQPMDTIEEPLFVDLHIKIDNYVFLCHKLTPEYVLDVLCLADIFILPGLKKLCASVIEESLTTDNILPLFKVSRLYNLPRLEDQCTEFMAEYLEEVINQTDFSNIVLDDAKEIKNREEVDTISVIDDIRYHIDRSERVSNNAEKHLLISRLLYNLKLEA